MLKLCIINLPNVIYSIIPFFLLEPKTNVLKEKDYHEMKKEYHERLREVEFLYLKTIKEYEKKFLRFKKEFQNEYNRLCGDLKREYQGKYENIQFQKNNKV